MIAMLASQAFGAIVTTLALSGGEKPLWDDPRYDLRPGLKITCKVKFDALRERGYAFVFSKGNIYTDRGSYGLRVNPPNEGGGFGFHVNFGDGPQPRAAVPGRVVPGKTYEIEAGWDGRDIYLSVDGVTGRSARPGAAAACASPLKVGPFKGEISDLVAGGPPPADTNDVTIGRALRMAGDVVFAKKPESNCILAWKPGEYLLRYDVKPGSKGKFTFFIDLGGKLEPRVELPMDVETNRSYHVFAGWDGLKLKLRVDGAEATMGRFGAYKPAKNPLKIYSVPGSTEINGFTVSSEKLPRPTVAAFHTRERMALLGRPFTLVAEVGNEGSAAWNGGDVVAEAPDGVMISSARQTVGPVEPLDRRRIAWTVDPGTNETVSLKVKLLDAKGRTLCEQSKRIGLMPEKIPDFSAKGWMPPVQPVRTWYVDSKGGDDSADGTSEKTAWKTFRNVNGRTLGPGERVLLKRGSVFREELVVTAHGAADNWAEIGAYGEGGRPAISRNRHIDDRCAYIVDPRYLVVRDLIISNAGSGLHVDCFSPDTGDVLVERCLAHHVEGSYWYNSHGIPEWFDRLGAPRKGHPATYRSFGISMGGRNARNLYLRDSELYQCSCGFGMGGVNTYAGRIFIHDEYCHNTSPHPGIGSTARSWLVDSIFDAAGWHASNGTMGLFLANNDGMEIRNCFFVNQPDSGSPDAGGIDFEAGGGNYLVEGCTFRDNAGAAIEVLGFMTTQGNNINLLGNRFIRNNAKNKIGPAEIFIGGGDGNHRVWCSTGSIVSNGYSTLEGVAFHVNKEKLTWPDWDVSGNISYATPEELAKAMPFNEPPRVDAGAEIWTDAHEVALAGTVEDEGPVSASWEQIEGPANAVFGGAAAKTHATFPVAGDYRLLLSGDDGELWRSARTAVHVLAKGERALKAWCFARNLDKEGWRSENLGTKKVVYPAGKWWRTSPTPVEPVDIVCGDYWVIAVEKSAAARICSPDNLRIPLRNGAFARVRMMNRTNAAKMRFVWETADGMSHEAAFDVKPNDVDDSICDVPLSGGGELRRIVLELGGGAEVTGTVRIDYIMIGDISKKKDRK